jgi:hypothetical protein
MNIPKRWKTDHHDHPCLVPIFFRQNKSLCLRAEVLENTSLLQAVHPRHQLKQDDTTDP